MSPELEDGLDGTVAKKHNHIMARDEVTGKVTKIKRSLLLGSYCKVTSKYECIKMTLNVPVEFINLNQYNYCLRLLIGKTHAYQKWSAIS